MDLFTTDANSNPVSTPDPEQELIEVTKAKFTKDGNLDVDALLKKAAHADKHIANIEQETQGLRKELDTRLSLEQFMDEIKSAKVTSNPPENNPGQNEPNQALSKDEIARLMREVINQDRSQAQKDYNKTQVADGLRKAWGNSFQSRLQEKATELGLSKETVNSLAEASPQAFLKLVDATAPVRDTTITSPPRNQVNRTTDIKSGVRNKAYYDELRKKMSTGEYWSAKVQKQYHEDVFALGDDFGL